MWNILVIYSYIPHSQLLFWELNSILARKPAAGLTFPSSEISWWCSASAHVSHLYLRLPFISLSSPGFITSSFSPSILSSHLPTAPLSIFRTSTHRYSPPTVFAPGVACSFSIPVATRSPNIWACLVLLASLFLLLVPVVRSYFFPFHFSSFPSSTLLFVGVLLLLLPPSTSCSFYLLTAFHHPLLFSLASVIFSFFSLSFSP